MANSFLMHVFQPEFDDISDRNFLFQLLQMYWQMHHQSLVAMPHLKFFTWNCFRCKRLFLMCFHYQHNVLVMVVD